MCACDSTELSDSQARRGGGDQVLSAVERSAIRSSCALSSVLVIVAVNAIMRETIEAIAWNM